MNDNNAPEQRMIDVDVEAIDTRGRTLHGYAAVYNVESEDADGTRRPTRPPGPKSAGPSAGPPAETHYRARGLGVG